jgi:hypothetical protein
MSLENIMFQKEEDTIILVKPLHMNCKICLKPYLLHIPYEEANRPARDLCDDCLINLDKDEFWSLSDGEVIQL